MGHFPAFIKNPLNRIASSSQYTQGIEGYLFDGLDGSQAALWECHETRTSQPHVHAFDEYMLVIEGHCRVTLPSGEVELGPGQELHIPAGTPQSVLVLAGTRTLHVFGGKRAERAG
ncbi:MAG TPA: cupin domain-containing protein [Polyangiaceae bacterium]|nr:cupin domain-containing protein [Polyangiaceae bacterium]